MVDRIKQLCKERKTNLKQLEIAAGIGNGVIARWDTSSPMVSKLLRVCSVLEVPLSAVVDDPYASAPPVIANQSADWCGAPPADDNSAFRIPHSALKEESLLSSFRELNQQGQTKVLTYIDDLLRNPENLAGDHPAQVV